MIRTTEQMQAAFGRPGPSWSYAERRGEVLSVRRWRHGPGRVTFDDDDAVVVIVNLSGGQHVRCRTPNERIASDAMIGTATIVDPSTPTTFDVKDPADVLQIVAAKSFLSRALEIEAGRTVRAAINIRDEEFGRLGFQLLVAANRGRVCAELAQSALAALGRRLVPTPPSGRGRPAVSAESLRRVDAAIAGAMSDPDWHAAPPTLAELADRAGCSANHLILAFRAGTGRTPHQYFMQRRMDDALALLARADAAVEDVAFTEGFASAAHFVASFRRRYGVTPGAFRDALAGR